MELNSRIKIQIDNDVCIINPYRETNTKTPNKHHSPSNSSVSNSFSYTISVSDEEETQKDNCEDENLKINKNDLEISYKSVFLSEKKSKGEAQLSDMIMLKNFEVKNLAENSDKTTSMASTLEKTDKTQKDLIIQKPSSFIQNDTIDSNSNSPSSFIQKASSTNKNSNRHEKYSNNKNSFFNLNLNKIKIKNKNTQSDKESLQKELFSKASLSTSNRTKKTFIKNYLKRILGNYTITNKKKVNSATNSGCKAPSLAKERKSHSHRGKSNISSILNNNNANKFKLITHNSSTSCLLLNKNKLHPSSSSLSIFNRSYQIQKANSLHQNKINSQSLSNLNTPTNANKTKIDSRNSILKHTLINTINKKYSNTPNLTSSSLSQRNSGKKYYIQTPNSLIKNKIIVPYLKKSMKTSPSPPKISKQTIMKEYINNNYYAGNNIKGIDAKKTVHTIKNFSNYVKKSKNSSSSSGGKIFLVTNKAKKVVSSARSKINLNKEFNKY